jgi:hypothetical protein
MAGWVGVVGRRAAGGAVPRRGGDALRQHPTLHPLHGRRRQPGNYPHILIISQQKIFQIIIQ